MKPTPPAINLRLLSPFKLQEVYALTATGLEELKGAETRLSKAQLDFLIRVDGRLNLAEIRQSMGDAPLADFSDTFADLRDQGLLALSARDSFDFSACGPGEPLSFSMGDGVADAATLSLNRAGYFVNIARPGTSARVPTPDAPLTAVVVEDEPTLGKFIQSYLGFEGIRARLARDRAEVLTELNKRPIPDLILLDVMLPDVDGFDILVRLRRHAVLRDVPVIMMTGKATREAVLRGLTSGADGYVTKPFEAESLMKAVRTVIGLPD